MMQMLGFRSPSPSAKHKDDDHSPSPSTITTTTATGPARPLRLVYCDEKGKFRMDPEAVATLQLVKGPLGVVSVCGRARQGKSFILNQGTYSTQIFSLAVLLSSMFVYNQMGGIDEAALDRLSLVTEMTKHIRVRASQGRTTAAEIGQFSPVFVWLLRDFYLNLAEDGRMITPREYLELALKPMHGAGKDIAAKNEVFKRNAYRDAELKCTSSVQTMDKKLRAACYMPGAKLDEVLQVLRGLLEEYEASSFGPEKWHKLANFLQQSLEGPILDLTKRMGDQSSAEKAALQLKCRSVEDKLGLLGKQLDVSQKHGSDYLKRYEDAVSDKKRISDEYASRVANMQSKYSSLEERYTNVSQFLESARKEVVEWKKKCDQLVAKQKIEEEQIGAEIASLKTRCSSAEARLSAAREQSESAKEEASEWRRKHDLAVKEAQASLEKATSLRERAIKQAQLREDSLRAEFSSTIAQKVRYHNPSRKNVADTSREIPSSLLWVL